MSNAAPNYFESAEAIDVMKELAEECLLDLELKDAVFTHRELLVLVLTGCHQALNAPSGYEQEIDRITRLQYDKGNRNNTSSAGNAGSRLGSSDASNAGPGQFFHPADIGAGMGASGNDSGASPRERSSTDFGAVLTGTYSCSLRGLQRYHFLQCSHVSTDITLSQTS